MEIKNFIRAKVRGFLNENTTSYPELIDLAKQYDYETFVEKCQRSRYDILYRGMYDEILEDKSFFADFFNHAKEYGDYVDGIIINNNDILYFDDATFNNLRKTLYSINKNALKKIYSYYFKNHKLFDAMDGEYSDEKSVINFVINFLKSDIPYSKVQKNKFKNDLLIPIMSYFAGVKGKNIVQFVGGDYSMMGGADEYVVDNISKYPKLSDIWKSVN